MNLCLRAQIITQFNKKKKKNFSWWNSVNQNSPRTFLHDWKTSVSLCNHIHLFFFSSLFSLDRRLSFIPVFNNMHQWEWIFAVGASDKKKQEFHYIPILFSCFLFHFHELSIWKHFIFRFKRHFRVKKKKKKNKKKILYTHTHTYRHALTPKLHQKKEKNFAMNGKADVFFVQFYFSVFNALHLFTDAFVFTSFSCCFCHFIPLSVSYGMLFFIRLAHKHTQFELYFTFQFLFTLGSLFRHYKFNTTFSLVFFSLAISFAFICEFTLL